MSKLLLKNIYKVYEGGVRAVSDFNLEINDKEFIVFVGPSGCGKSTTLRMIAGLEDITSGQLYIDDELMNDVEPKDRNIAMVFQNYALYPNMTVFQNMSFGLKLRKTPHEEIEEKVNNAAKILGIENLLTRKPKALSGGQRQRVALGRAIVRNPKVFLLDEPLSNLDAKLRVQMRTEITKLHKQVGTTFIYVTHDQTEAMTMGDRIVVMSDGVIQQVDTPTTLYEDPRNVFVASFLGSPQMNIFNVKLTKENDLLNVSFGLNKVAFNANQNIELIDPTKVGEEVLFGIRPENISLANKGIPAYIDQIEELGSEIILYLKIEGVDDIVTAKVPSSKDIKAETNVFVEFDMAKGHLFDKDTEISILGVKEFNSFDISLKSDTLTINKEKVKLPEAITDSLLDIAETDAKKLSISLNDTSLVEVPDSFSLKTKVVDLIKKNECNYLYLKAEHNDEYIVVKTDSTKFKKDEEVIVYLPFKSISIEDSMRNRLNVHDRIYKNSAICELKNEGNKSIITIDSQKLVFNKLPYEDGKYNFIIKSDKAKILFTKAFIKDEKNREYVEPTNSLKCSAYDEEKSRTFNVIYLKVKGFENYVTLINREDFSVYKMPEFRIGLDENSFMLESCE